MIGWLLGRVALGVLTAIVIDTVVECMQDFISELKNQKIKKAVVKFFKNIDNNPDIVHVSLDAMDEDDKPVQVTMEVNREFAERELHKGQVITTV